MGDWIHANDGLVVGCILVFVLILWCFISWALCRLAEEIAPNEKARERACDGEQDQKESD